MKIIIIIVSLIIILLLNELFQGIYRQKQRNNIYKMAEARSKEINKPLVVIGDPHNGYGSKFYNKFMVGYGCGDVTIDLTGCPQCPNGVKMDIYEYLKTQDDNSQVIFISCVLEYIDNIEDVVKELYRVAGKDNLFIVTVKKLSLAAHIYQESNYGAKHIIKAPPKYDTITWETL